MVCAWSKRRMCDAQPAFRPPQLQASELALYAISPGHSRWLKSRLCGLPPRPPREEEARKGGQRRVGQEGPERFRSSHEPQAWAPARGEDKRGASARPEAGNRDRAAEGRARGSRAIPQRPRTASLGHPRGARTSEGPSGPTRSGRARRRQAAIRSAGPLWGSAATPSVPEPSRTPGQ